MNPYAEQPKWVCEYCTYENFPSALKCTMCTAPRPLSEVEDIYNLQDKPCTDSEAVPSISESTESSVWYCGVCKTAVDISYGECPRCQSNKLSSSDIEEQFSSLRINENEDIVDQKRDSKKWCCSVCTYENWPKSTKCIMCLHPRGKVSPASSSSLDTDGFSGHARMKKSSGSSASPINNMDLERRVRAQKKLYRNVDMMWLNACIGVVKDDPTPVLAYLSSGGDPSRQLTAHDIKALNLSKPKMCDVGHTLVHLAIRFNREDILATLLSQMENGSKGLKRVPSYIAPDLAADIRRHFSTSLIRQRKTNALCPFVNEHTTFYLPTEIDELPLIVQEQLFEEILDKDVQKQLEAHRPPVINWSRMCSRLHALWNRSAGDCLLDSILQATWGVFDRDNTLRRALAECLTTGGHIFYPRWKEYESIQATLLEFTLEEEQWQQDWSSLVSLATQPGSSLEQLHIFALAHILRRPIIVYGVKSVKSFRGEDIGYAKFEGVYLPLLWDPSFCIKTPIALGYTRGHFSALVPSESDAAPINSSSDLYSCVAFLPLMDHNRCLLPVHFLSQTEMGQEEILLRQWMEVFVTDSGLMIAQQKLHKKPLLVAQMLEEWLNYYRRFVQMSLAPFKRPIPTQDYWSDGESDDE